MTIQVSTASLAEQVIKYAYEHHNEGTWDYVVECFTTEDVEQAITGETTFEGALKRVKEVTSVMQELMEG